MPEDKIIFVFAKRQRRKGWLGSIKDPKVPRALKPKANDLRPNEAGMSTNRTKTRSMERRTLTQALIPLVNFYEEINRELKDKDAFSVLSQDDIAKIGRRADETGIRILIIPEQMTPREVEKGERPAKPMDQEYHQIRL